MEGKKISTIETARICRRARIYSDWQAAFRGREPKTLIVCGKSDPFFTPAGARAYLKDLREHSSGGG